MEFDMTSSQYIRTVENPYVEPIAGDADATLVDHAPVDLVRCKSKVDFIGVELGVLKPMPGNRGLTIGALVRLADLAIHPMLATQFTALYEALLSSGSSQLRDVTTVNADLLQRTQCLFFRDSRSACNKREPGSGCAARIGYTRNHAVLGTSEHCIASNPSDMNVALTALDARVRIRDGSGAERQIPVEYFHTLPGAHPEIESVLAPGDLIISIEIPATALSRSHYLKVRDRASLGSAIALASTAVALELDGQFVRDARIVLGGVGTKPWRAHEAESILVGKPLDRGAFYAAAEAALAGATPTRDNAFKVELAKHTVVAALNRLVSAA